MKKLKQFLIIVLCLSMLLSTVACKPKGNNQGENPNMSDSVVKPNVDNDGGKPDMSALAVKPNAIPLKIWYDEQAPFNNECSEEASMMAGQDIGWQNWSFPLGNGYVGANVLAEQRPSVFRLLRRPYPTPGR